MQLKVLGCSGGIGGENRTTAFLLDEHVLIDAGTGVGSLSLESLLAIDHIFLTHAHFDHIACLPMLLDTVAGMRRGAPITLHARRDTITILQEHVFNWRIWPDFSLIPDESNALLHFSPQEVGETHEVAGCRITALPAVHTVPAVGFGLDSGKSTVVFSGDSTGGDAFWAAVNSTQNLATLIIETAFPVREASLAHAARHLCPATLQCELARLTLPAEILITHLKPADSELILHEIEALGLSARALCTGEVIEF
ncbi:MAG: 3',5'-cyclic-nucleotide phosphodiesterase [Formivibrio sp.]|nr:3',5'-cyclic-nucleotide phosphodiesterase [Formivibrio sp.]